MMARFETEGMDVQEMGERESTARRWVVGLALCLLGSLLTYSVLLACTVQIEFHSGYEYLSNSLIFSGYGHPGLHVPGVDSFYHHHRPPLVPLLLAPLMAWYEIGGGGLSVIGPHLVSWLLSIGCLAAFYKWLRLAFDASWSLCGVLFLAVNPIFFQYTTFVQADIPATALVVCGWWAYVKSVRSDRSGRYEVAVAVLFALAMLAKYNMLLLLGGVCFTELALARREEEGTGTWGRYALNQLCSKRLWIFAAGGLGLWYGAHVVIYGLVLEDSNPWTLLSTVFFQHKEHIARLATTSTDPWHEIVSSLALTCTVPVLICVAVGTVCSARARTDTDLVSLIAMSVFIAVQALMVPHTEARYALPVLPAVLYLAARGARWIFEVVAARAFRGTLVVWGPVVWLCCAVPFVGPPLLDQIQHFRDPVYTQDTLNAFAHAITIGTEPDDLVVIRDAYHCLYPNDPVFLPNDEYFYLHHVWMHNFTYLLNRPVRVLRGGEGLQDANVLAMSSRDYARAFRRSGVCILTVPGVNGTADAVSAGYPPAPMQAVFVERRSYTLQDATATTSRGYRRAGSGDEPDTRTPVVDMHEGWRPAPWVAAERWSMFVSYHGGPRWVAFDASCEDLPAAVELVRLRAIVARVGS